VENGSSSAKNHPSLELSDEELFGEEFFALTIKCWKLSDEEFS
jgi:hypothetical protein